MRPRRPAVLAALLVLVLTGPLLAGCTIGEAGSFRGRANDLCAQVTRSVSRYRAPVTPDQSLKYALDRYQNIERIVSEISEDVARPGGSTGRALDAGWFDPARASLRQGRTDLFTLRTITRSADPSGTRAALLTAIAAGTRGVDTDLLRRQGLDRCAVTFTTPAAVPTI